MHPRRTIGSIAVLVLLAMVLLVTFLSRSKPAPSPNGAPIPSATKEGIGQNAPPPSGPVEPTQNIKAPIASPTSGETESIRYMSFLLRDQNAVHLDETEIQAISTLYASLQTEKGRHEAAIAEVKVHGPSTIEVRIPEFRDYGDTLRSKWYAGLTAIVGTERTADLLNSKPPFEYLFSSYGNTTQNYQVTASYGRDGTIQYRGDYQILTAAKMTDSFTRGENGHAPFVSAEHSISLAPSDLDGGDYEVLRHYVDQLTPAAP